MKKKILIPIATALALVIISFPIYQIFYDGAFVGKTHNDIEISNEVVLTNKSYGELAKVGNKLYYNYEPQSNVFDLLNYGLYEISSNGTKRVYWGGIKITDGSNLFKVDSAGENLIKSYSDLLYEDISYGEIYSYNPSSKNFEIINKLSKSTPAQIKACKYVNGRYFYYLQNSLYVQNGDTLEKIVDLQPTLYGDESPLYRFFINSNCEVYYIKPDGNTCVLCRYDLSEKKESKLTSVDLPYKEVTELYIDGGKAVIGLTSDENDISQRDSMYVAEIADDSNLQQLLSKTTDYGRTLIYNGKLYFLKHKSDTDAICSIELSFPQKESIIYEGDIANIHIIDGQGVYFTDSSKALYRVSLNGEKLETVFG